MLAQAFKTAAELGLKDAEFSALLKTLGMLEREEIPAELFRMSIVGHPECGTPGCILGWARTVGFPPASMRGMRDGLEDLFLPTSANYHVYSATRAQAAVALRSYLTTGEPRWDEAMS